MGLVPARLAAPVAAQEAPSPHRSALPRVAAPRASSSSGLAGRAKCRRFGGNSLRLLRQETLKIKKLNISIKNNFNASVLCKLHCKKQYLQSLLCYKYHHTKNNDNSFVISQLLH